MRKLINEYKVIHDSSDPWGSSMGAMFDLAAELYMREDGTIPDEWEYSPGANSGDPREPSSYLFDIFKNAETSSLEDFGEVLYRYVRLLRAAGRNY